MPVWGLVCVDRIALNNTFPSQTPWAVNNEEYDRSVTKHEGGLGLTKQLPSREGEGARGTYSSAKRLMKVRLVLMELVKDSRPAMGACSIPERTCGSKCVS